MNPKKNILILSDWFLPGYLAGGPIQSIATLTAQLNSEFNFKIITTDRDFKSNKAYESIKINEWMDFEGRSVFYISPENLNSFFLLNLINKTPHDTIYLNSLFSKFFSINILRWKQQKKITSPIILAPRGMLGNGALAIKPLKKQLFLMYAKLAGLFKNVHWQSTSIQETFEIKKRIASNVKLTQVSNLPSTISGNFHAEKITGILKLCFISRISEKKNLNFAIEILKNINNIDIIFDVFGPIEDETYWEHCKKNARELPNNISFNYNGSLNPKDIGITLSNYHALFLPTQNENYGHIIVETLQHGRPVILSDQTPWRNLEKELVGFDIDLNTKQKFIDSIIKLNQLNQFEFDRMCSTCITYINQKLNIDEIKSQYMKLFA